MAQIFHKLTNPLSKASIFGGIFIVAALVSLFDLLYSGPYVNERDVIREQPVPFSHKHHVGELGIDCRYCHASAASSSFAGIPPVQTCMSCHSQIWTDADMLRPVRDAYQTGRPLRWVRVNTLPHYVYFDHSIHVNKGVACVVCHGPVGDMPLTWRQTSLEMRWCLSCHENPEKFVRPRDAVFRTDYATPRDQELLGRRLVQEYHIKKMTDCSTCHR